MELIPIKVTFGRRKNGHADYPDFNRVSEEVRKGMKWSQYIDSHCIGWHYDQVDNLGTGYRHGTVCTLAPADFAEEASTLFGPDGPEFEQHVVTILTEAEFGEFWDTRSKVNQETEILSNVILEGIKSRIDLENSGDAPEPSDEIKELRKRRLNPSDELPGISKNHERYWKDAKVKRKVQCASDDEINELRNRVNGGGL